jgi:hypothetical protein
MITPREDVILKKKHPHPMNKADKKCVVCKLDLNTQKSFQEREDWESVKFCSSKCRKATNARSHKRR